MVKVAILCGGLGSRLWPLSRKERPKQFMKLPEAHYNLFQETILRLDQLKMECSELIIISNIELEEEILDCVNNLSIKCPITFIWEPLIRNTGPAICSLIDYHLSTQPNDDHYIIWPSDHLLCMETFNKSIEIANQYIDDNIITFGICPTYPEIGYGYITSGADYRIEKFIEKPPYLVAEELIKNSNCYWNSGMFYFKGQLLVDEYQQKDSEMLNNIHQSFDKKKIDGNFTHIFLNKHNYEKCREIPFDKLIMEQTQKGRVIPFNGRWSDIGSWDSLSKLNMDTSQKDVIQLDNENCHIYNYNDKQLISAIGLKNLCIINTCDALLISDLSQTQKVKTIYQQLDNIKSLSVQKHIKNEHSWGSCEQLEVNHQIYKIVKMVINEKMGTLPRHHKNQLAYLICLSDNGMIQVDNHDYQLLKHQTFILPKNKVYKIINCSEIEKLHLLLFKFY